MQVYAIQKDKLKGLEVVSKFQNEVNLNFTKEGLRVVTTDRALVCMLDLFIYAGNFDLYEVAEQNKNIALDLNKLTSVMKRLDKKVQFEVKDNRLTIKDKSKTFKIPLLNKLDNEIPPISDIPNSSSEA